MRIALVSSLQSGRGYAHKTAQIARTILVGLGVSVGTMIETMDLALLRQQIRDAVVSESIDAVVVCGGDGLVHQALQEMAGCEKPLGIIPAGTGNDMAKAYNIPESILGAAKLIAATPIQKVDLGLITMANGLRHFYGTIAYTGFDGNVTARAGKINWAHGKLRYTIGALQELFTTQVTRGNRTHADISGPDTATIDDNRVLTALAMTPNYGGGNIVAPDAKMDDGIIDVTSIRPLGRIEFLSYFLFQKHRSLTQSAKVDTYKATEVTIDSSAPLWADGEYIGTGRATVTVAPGACHLICPPLAK